SPEHAASLQSRPRFSSIRYFMRDQGGSYAHRGAIQRRAHRIKRQILGVSVCAVLLIVYQSNRPAEAAAPAPDPMAVAKQLERELARTRGELEVANEQLERWHQIFKYSARYDISAELA